MLKKSDILDTLYHKNISHRENLIKEMLSKISLALYPFAFIDDIQFVSNPNSPNDINDTFTIIFLCYFSIIFIDYNKRHLLDDRLKDLNVAYTYPKHDSAKFYIFFSSNYNYSYIEKLPYSEKLNFFQVVDDVN